MLVLAQEIELFQQFNGRYDYLAFGNTLNIEENTGGTQGCVILTESSADFALEPGQTLVAAYLYWAGVGPGDFEVLLNGTAVTAERTFLIDTDGVRMYFSAYADVTSIIAATGNGTYTLSELDLTEILPTYCVGTTNFGGWAVNVIYEDASLTLNQVNLFDGFEFVSASNPELTITLENLNVLDNVGAKIGFLAWEGDTNIAVNETLKINGATLSNPPLNPENNAFNGTNSFTNSAELYNMDMDFYNIESNINPGDESAVISLTSGQDFVIINNIFTVLNTELPDATIVLDSVVGGTSCGDKEFDIEYTVYNVESTDELPANTPIAFYANNTLIGLAQTTIPLPIGGSESGSISVVIPDVIPSDFTLRAVVDDTGNGTGIVRESNETNNEASEEIHLLVFPDISRLQNLELCDVFGTEIFDLTEATAQIDPLTTIVFYTSETDAQNEENEITTPEAYLNTSNPETIWVRVSNPDCFVIGNFTIEVINCPLPDATITIEDNLFACRQRDLTLDFTVFNTEGTSPLPAGTPIAFYALGILIGQSETVIEVPIGGSEPSFITVLLPDSLPNTFTIIGSVDDDGTGTGIVFELNDTNNTFEILVEFGTIPPINMLPDLVLCDIGNNTAIFDVTVQDDLISEATDDEINYYISLDDAIANTNPILNTTTFQNTSDPQTIYVRLENEICFTTASFQLTTQNCKPEIPQGISPNNDGMNDVFEITGLIDVYDDFELHIYSREGNLIYKGSNEEGFWEGIPNTGLLYKEVLAPTGTYYYVLFLNDAQYPEPFTGFVYVNY